MLTCFGVSSQMSLWSSTENSLYHSAEAFSWFPFVPQPGLSTWATVDQGDSSWIKGFHSGKLKLASSLAVHFTLSLRVTPQKKLIIQGSHGLLSPWVKRSALHSHPLISVKSKWGVSLWIWSTKTKWQISRSCVLLTIGKLKSLLFGWDAWRIFFFLFFFFLGKHLRICMLQLTLTDDTHTPNVPNSNQREIHKYFSAD